MGIRIRPTNQGDIKETYGEVNTLLSKTSKYDANSIDSQDIFGSMSLSGNLRNSDIYSRRGYIKFAKPVLNFFLAGKNAEILKQILGKNVKEIAEGNLLYSKELDRELTIQELGLVDSINNVLIGGEYITYLIDVFDVNHAIMDMIERFVLSILNRQTFKSEDKIKKLMDVGSLSYKNGKIWIIDNYYFNPLILLDEIAIKKKLDEYRPALLSKLNSHLTMLLSLKKDKSIIRDQVMDYMQVLPIGYRPSIDKKKDPITKAYNRVVRCNNDLANAMKYSNARIEDIRIKYKELVAEVKNVMVEKSYYMTDEGYSPLAEMLAHKEGIIRSKMQSSRADYTGRSVITVNPNMSIKNVGIPKSMAAKLVELDVIKGYQTKSRNRSGALSQDLREYREKRAANLLEGEYVGIGRQPTLHYLGMQAYEAKVIDGNAIELPALIVKAFNADFDGDQMHVQIPQTLKGKQELKRLMAFSNNLFLPRNGECHIKPRQEILYGLWKASSAVINEQSAIFYYDNNNKSEVEIFQKVCSGEISVYDEIIMNGKGDTAGVIAVRMCMGSGYKGYKLGVLPLTKGEMEKDKSVTESWFTEILKEIILDSKDKFISVIDNLTKLGFAVANIFPPNISVLNYPSVSHLIDEFDEAIREREETYNMGFETESSFTAFYDKEYSILEQKVKSELKQKLGEGNGFYDMVVSGARGSMSNIIQLFGMKGRVMKNENEAFNAIIRQPMTAQLTGLEHFITAYGARQGLVDKVIATYKPGYLSRKMTHTAALMSIVSDDCGTSNGILIDYDFMKQYISNYTIANDEIINNKLVKDYAAKLLIGRYIVGINAEIATREDAEDIYDARIAEVVDGHLIKKEGLRLRSPITCEKPCCVKCYGKDLGSMMESVKGLPIGYIAAQSIGEPGTQLTMKNFQNGGVAGVTNLTSSFDTMSDYLHVAKLGKNPNQPRNYDFISPEEGKVETVSRGDGTKMLQIIGLNKKGDPVNLLGRKMVLLHEEIPLKNYVRKGDSIQLVQGDLDINEILEYRGADEAQRYMACILYNIFQKEVDVNLKHFETLVAAMTMYLCLKGNSEQFKTGSYYTIQEYWNGDRSDCIFEKQIKGIKDIPTYRSDLLSTILMENIEKGVTRSIITSGYDSLTNPLVRTAFGLSLEIGSDVDGYMERRGRV